jgi:hypothetical protein
MERADGASQYTCRWNNLSGSDIGSKYPVVCVKIGPDASCSFQ